MSPKKKVRPTVPAPDPGDNRGTLRLLFARADYLRQRWLEASPDGHNAVGPEAASKFESGYGIPIWIYVTLHLACLYTVVEGWRRLGLSDPVLDSILKDDANVDQLRALRDGVFHFGAIDNPAIMSVLSNKALLGWAGKVHAAVQSHLDA